MLRNVLLGFALLISGALADVIQTCTWKDGSVAQNYLPCGNSTATSGPCCLEGETCTENGLCYGSVGLVYRGACINEWGGDCLTYCDDIATEFANFFPCAFAGTGSTDGPESWWCGAAGTTMCTQTNGTHIISMDPGIGTKILTKTSATGSASTIIAGSSIASTTADASDAARTSGSAASQQSVTNAKPAPNNSGAMIGIGVVLGILVLLCVVGAIWGVRKYRQQQARLALMMAGHKDEMSAKGAYQPTAIAGQGALNNVEIEGYQKTYPAELESSRAELASDSSNRF